MTDEPLGKAATFAEVLAILQLNTPDNYTLQQQELITLPTTHCGVEIIELE